MKKLIIILIVFITVFSDLYAGPGDTTWVQTFSFSDITKRRGWYVFPDDSMRWEKILMLYTLKCDPATTHDQYPCGEWDYTTYTHLYQYDGFDNPCYYVNTLLPDSIPLSYNPVYTYYQNYQYSMVIDNTISENAYLSGTAGSAVQHALQSGIRNNRAQYLWTAAEMTASGMTAGDINKLILDIQATGPELKYLKIKMKNSALAEISPGSYESGLTTVYAQNTMITSTGPVEIILTTPFNWDGTSNLLIEFSFSNSIAGTDFQVAGEDAGFNCGVYSLQDDPFLSFFQYDYVEVPAGAFATIDSFITIAFWQYGDTAIQPTNSYIFEGKNASNYRVINCHLPWSNSRVYWDAGNSATSSYDRIDKDALPEEYKGKWNHWALTKNVATGEMKMYLNGSLWHSGSGFTRTMAGIDKFKIAGRADEVGHYDGFINDFSVWDIDLDSAEINACMFRDIDPSHPEYSHLKAYYMFDENSGITAFDSSPNGYDALLVGLPGWKDTRGEEQFRNLQGTTERPVLSFVSGSYTSHIDSVLVNDSLVNAQVSVIEKQPYIDFGNSGMSFTVLDTIWGWEAGNMNIWQDDTIAGTIYAEPDTVFYNIYRDITYQLQNYVTPYGINLDLGADGFTWVYDVTDYKPLFHDTVEISAGNQQELIDLKFMMIEGIPPRDPMDVISVWRGDYGHAAIADDIALPAVDVPLDPSASQYMVRTRTTGHGMSTVENCAEFCPKYHNMSINGSMEFAWLNWTECAANPVYPQGGTWVYDRAGWCPGSFADTYDWEITDLVSPGDTVSVDYGMQMYPAGGGEGNYRITVQLFEYGAPNFINDAAISELISPSNADYYNRQNPVCGMPEIEIKNTGSADLSSLTISYGLEGSLDYTYNWSGNLKFLQKERVKLPPVNWDYLNDNSSRFQVSVSQPNGVADEYPYNNSMLSEFDLTPVYFDDIIVVFRTNSAPQENYWELTDASGNVVYSRSSFAANTLHPDTAILTTGCYTLSLYDTDDDGISWWANNDGSGWMRIRLLNGSYIYTFPADFGKLTSHSFVIDHVTSSDVYPEEGLVNVYPNPSEGIINVNLRLKKQQDVSVSILDIYGRIIYSEQLDDVCYKHLKTDLSDQPDGVYFVRVAGETINVTRKVVLK